MRGLPEGYALHEPANKVLSDSALHCSLILVHNVVEAQHPLLLVCRLERCVHGSTGVCRSGGMGVWGNRGTETLGNGVWLQGVTASQIYMYVYPGFKLCIVMNFAPVSTH